MNLKQTYLILETILTIFLIIMAVITPIYFTVGLYYWSAFLIFLMIANIMGTTDRVNSWGDLGKL